MSSSSSFGDRIAARVNPSTIHVILCLSVVIASTLCESANHKWHYDEQHSWANLPNSKCAELKQSPINIETDDVTEGDTGLTLIGYDDPLDGSYFTLENNGHTVQLTIDDDHLDNELAPRAKLNNGNTYRFKQLHFHWHQNDTKGSEHAINGRQSALEMHNVHWNEKYGTISKALEHQDGILVVASLFKVSSETNENFEPLIQLLRQVQSVKSTTSYRGDLLLGKFIPSVESFYHYNGSLTTPPCTVAVSWFVFPELGEISTQQLDAFRSVLTHDHSGKPRRLSYNVRDIQPVGNRQIIHSSLLARQDIDLLPERANGATSSTSSACIIILSMVSVIRYFTTG